MTEAGSAWTAGRTRPAASRGRILAMPLSQVLTWAAVIASFSLSHLMLEHLGLAYETPGGSAWQKIAPATFISVLALLVLAFERGPENLLSDILQRHKGTVLLMAVWLIQFAQVVLMQMKPMTSTIDTFIFPMALFLLIVRFGERQNRAMALFIHAFMAGNALLGIAEFALGFRLTPIMAQGIELVEWRSSAMFGHPLVNALTTGSYALVLLVGGGRDLPRLLFPAALSLQFAAMIVFGGRGATALLAVFAIIIGVYAGMKILSGRRFSLTAAAAVAFVVPAVVIGIGLVVAEGFLDRFLMRFVDDEGSASARLVMFDVLGRFTFEELLIGPDQATLATLQRVYGIAFGIESFWFAFIAFYGLLTSIPFFVGLLAFFYDLWSKARPSSGWVIFYFLAVCSTSLSIAGKSTMIGVLVAMIIVLLRRRPASGSA